MTSTSNPTRPGGASSRRSRSTIPSSSSSSSSSFRSRSRSTTTTPSPPSPSPSSTRPTPPKPSFLLLSFSFTLLLSLPFVQAGTDVYSSTGSFIRGQGHTFTSLSVSLSSTSANVWSPLCSSTNNACSADQKATTASDDVGASETITFAGTGIAVNGSVQLNTTSTRSLSSSGMAGYLSFSLDGQPVRATGVVPNLLNQEIFTAYNLTEANHTLILYVNGGTVGVRLFSVEYPDSLLLTNMGISGCGNFYYGCISLFHLHG